MTDKDLQAPDDDFDVVVDGAPEPAKTVEAETDGNAATAGVAAETAAQTDGGDELADLRRTVEDGKRRTAEDEARRLEIQKERDRLREEYRQEVDNRVRAQETALESGAAAWTSQLAGLKRDYAAALENGEWDKAADVQASIAEAQIEIRAYKARAEQLKAWKQAEVKKAEDAAKAATTQAPEAADPLAHFTPRTRAWIERHADNSGKPRFLTDDTFRFKALAADSQARTEKYIPDTDAYFDFVERYMGLKDDGAAAAAAAATTPERRPAASSAAAPPSRGNGAGAARQPNRQTVKLTAEEHDYAIRSTMLGATKEERIKAYAKNKMAAIAAGNLKGTVQ